MLSLGSVYHIPRRKATVISSGRVAQSGGLWYTREERIFYGTLDDEEHTHMTLTVPCLFGLESLVANEIKRLGLEDVRAENGRVHCKGALADIPRLNINLRCGARVLMELGVFPRRHL
jgi:hypothetical protein